MTKWKDIKDFEGLYQVSSDGQVRSVDRVIVNSLGIIQRYKGKLLCQNTQRSGHLHVVLSKNNRQEFKTIHRLVALAFLDIPEDNTEVCHNDGNPKNNNVSNLRWGTRTDNNLDAVKHGSNWQTKKQLCNYGHSLEQPNLVSSMLKRKARSCLACSRARAIINRDRRGEGLSIQANMQFLSDQKYLKIMEKQ